MFSGKFTEFDIVKVIDTAGEEEVVLERNYNDEKYVTVA